MLSKRIRKLGRRLATFLLKPLGTRRRSWWIRMIYSLEKRGFVQLLTAERLASLPSSQQLTVRIKDGPGSFLYASPEWDRLNALSIVDFAGWERKSRLLFSILAKDSRVIVDVGAYTGVFSLVAAVSSPATRVWAFEPFPRTHEALVKNIQINELTDRIFSFPTALGSDERNRFIDLKDGDSSMATVADFGSVAVKQTNLDQVVQAECVDLIKVDAEGAEFDVLRGSSSVLSRCQPTVVAEALTRTQWEELNTLLIGYGYLEGRAVGTAGGDERNFVWVVPQKSDLVTKVLGASPSS